MSDDNTASTSSDITCYDRFGDETDTRFPCSLDGSLAQCCRKNQVCASNGLCLSDKTDKNQFLPYAVEGCTDRRWGSSGCVDACLDLGVGVDNCPDLGDDVFCCYGTQGCNCSSMNNDGIFRRESASGIVTLDTTGLLPASETPSPTSSSAEATASDITSSISSTTSTTNNANASTGSPAAETTTSSSDSNSSNPSALGIGLGLGIPLVIIIAILAFCLLRRRRRNRTAETPPSELSPGTLSPSHDTSAYNKMQQAGGYGHGYNGDPQAPNYGAPAELGGTFQTAELPASEQGAQHGLSPQYDRYGQSMSSAGSGTFHASPTPSHPNGNGYQHDHGVSQHHHILARPVEMPGR